MLTITLNKFRQDGNGYIKDQRQNRNNRHERTPFFCDNTSLHYDLSNKPG